MRRIALTIIILAVFVILMAALLPSNDSPRYPYLPTPAWATITPTPAHMRPL